MSAGGRPSLARFAADVTLRDAVAGERCLRWLDADDRERIGTLRTAGFTADGTRAATGTDPRDSHIRVTLHSGFDIYPEWEALADALMEGRAELLAEPVTCYTAIGFWGDDDLCGGDITVQLVGIVPGEHHDVFGGDGVTEGGPWADVFQVPAGQDPEAWILDRLPVLT